MPARMVHRRSAAARGIFAAAVIAFGPGVPAVAQTPAPTTPTPVDYTPPTVGLQVLTKMRSSLVSKGVTVTVTLNEPGSVAVVIFDGAHRQVSKAGSGLASLPNGGPVTLTVKLTPATRVKVRRGAKVSWKVEATGTDGTGNTRTTRANLRVR